MSKSESFEKQIKDEAANFLVRIGYDGSKDIKEKLRKPKYLTKWGKAKYLDRLRKGDIRDGETQAVDVLSGYKAADKAQGACWYPGEDPKPQAKPILDECGVQTYEVEAITEELSDDYTGNLEGAQTLHVEKKAVSGGVQFQVTSSDLSGAYLTSDYDTAKQLFESLGYEVVE